MSIAYSVKLDATLKEVDTVDNMFSIANNFKRISEVKNLFVAGCGDGTEASAIRNTLKINVVGVDNCLLNEYEDETLKVLNRDLMTMDFADNSFDLIYSYHVLEHVPDPKVVLGKLRSMLTEGGIAVIGFPNKSRLLGYIGSKEATLKEKIKWNIKDYGDRIKGRFENKYGAHAGFTRKEFFEIATCYSSVNDVTNEYFLNKYKSKTGLITLLIKLNLSNFLFPSNYFICYK